MADNEGYTLDELRGGPAAPQTPPQPNVTPPATPGKPVEGGAFTIEELRGSKPPYGGNYKTYKLPSGETTYSDIDVGGVTIPQSGAVVDVMHRAPEYYREAQKESRKGFKGMADLPEYAKTHNPLMTAHRGAEDLTMAVLGQLGMLGAGPAAAFDTTAGRAIDVATGGTVPTPVGGTLASLATGLGEPRLLSGLSRAGQAKKLGEIEPAFRRGMTEAEQMEKTLAGVRRPGIVDRTLEAFTTKDPAYQERVQNLKDFGVKEFTPGQMRGPREARIESKKTSGPLTGEAYAQRYRETLQDLNRATYQHIAKVGGAQMPPDAPKYGPDALRALRTTLQGKYTDLLKKVRFSDAVPVENAMAKIRSEAENVHGDMFLDKKHTAKLENLINNQILHFVQTGGMDGQRFKRVESNLNTEAKDFISKGGEEAKYGRAVMALKVALHDAMIESSPPALAKALKENDKAYAMYKRVNRAMTSTANADGVWTPAQMEAAYKALDQSLDKRAFAEADYDLDRVMRDAKVVMSNPYPDSGTAGRGLHHIVGPLVGTTLGGALGHLVPIPGAEIAGAVAGTAGGAVLDDILASIGSEMKLKDLRKYSARANETAAERAQRVLPGRQQRAAAARAATLTGATPRPTVKPDEDDR